MKHDELRMREITLITRINHFTTERTLNLYQQY